MANKTNNETAGLSRRNFIKTSAAAVVLASMDKGVFAAGSDKIRIGLIGCGGRGAYDTANCLNSSPNVELTAMGDVFKDRLDGCLAELNKKLSDKISVTEETCFIGFDAYKKVLECNVDMVILTAPPHFRPEHLKASIEAGKHVFAEKPVAVDPAGVRSVISSSELADSKNLTIVTGTQARRMPARIELIKRIHNGDIGDIVAGKCIRMGGGLMDWGPRIRKAGWTDMEWQMRRWLFVNWLSGDFIAEQHIHELDIVNWCMNSHPIRCIGIGGRQGRTGAEYGNIFDHFSVEYEYPNNVRVSYIGSQIDGCSGRCNERIIGTKGLGYTDWSTSYIEGQKPFEYNGPTPDPCLRQHADQIDAIVQGKALNEGRRIAESSLTAIMGRMSAYTGRALKWDWVMNSSKLDLSPSEYEFGDLALEPVAIPGKTKLI